MSIFDDDPSAKFDDSIGCGWAVFAAITVLFVIGLIELARAAT